MKKILIILLLVLTISACNIKQKQHSSFTSQFIETIKLDLKSDSLFIEIYELHRDGINDEKYHELLKAVYDITVKELALKNLMYGTLLQELEK